MKLIGHPILVPVVVSLLVVVITRLVLGHDGRMSRLQEDSDRARPDSEWAAWGNSRVIWDQLAFRADARKRRLFACACSRKVWHLLSDDCRIAVEIAERYA